MRADIKGEGGPIRSAGSGVNRRMAPGEGECQGGRWLPGLPFFLPLFNALRDYAQDFFCLRGLLGCF